VSVLLVQHESSKALLLAAALEHAGHRVKVEAEGAGPEPVDAAAFDVVAIGAEQAADNRVRLCVRLRAEGYLGAIVVVGVEPDQVSTLVDAGADDFVLAPVQELELVARVAMARRRVVARARSHWGPMEIDRVHRTASLRGQALPLTAREYALLECLLEAGGEVISRADLLSKVWARDDDPGTNLVEVHLSRLRDKLGEDASLIETVRRAGYRLRREPGRQPS
jgi:DNA-binding response OmpR family regulator